MKRGRGKKLSKKKKLTLKKFYSNIGRLRLPNEDSMRIQKLLYYLYCLMNVDIFEKYLIKLATFNLYCIFFYNCKAEMKSTHTFFLKHIGASGIWFCVIIQHSQVIAFLGMYSPLSCLV